MGDNVSPNATSPEATGGDDAFGSSVQSGPETASGTNSLLYFFLIWLLLLLFVVAFVPLVVFSKRRLRLLEEERQQMADVEAVEKAPNNNHPDLHRRKNFRQAGWMILLITVAMGLALSIFSIMSCDFLNLSDSLTYTFPFGGNDGDQLGQRIEFYSIGLWAVGLSSDANFLSGPSDSCFEISGQIILDWQFELARASAVLASLIGGLCLLVLTFRCCCLQVVRTSTIRKLVGPLLVAAVFQFMTMFIFETMYCEPSNNCNLSIGGVASYTAALYWIFSSGAAFLYPSLQ